VEDQLEPLRSWLKKGGGGGGLFFLVKLEPLAVLSSVN